MKAYRGWFLRLNITFILCGVYVAWIYPCSLRLWLQGRLEDQLSQRLYTQNRAPSEADQIVLVSMDDESLPRLNLRWPWDRKLYVPMLERISAGKPRLIAMDIVFSGESNPDSDQALADAIKKAGNVLLAAYLDNRGQIILPLERFVQAALGIGTINHPRDIDFVMRRTTLFHHDLTPLWAMSLDIACRLLNGRPQFREQDVVIIGDANQTLRALPVASDGSMRVRYRVRESDIRVIPMWRLLQSDIAPETFKDKIVFIAFTGIVFHDRHLTPLGTESGVIVMINALLTQLSNAASRPIPAHLQWMLLLCATLLSAFATTRHPLVGLTILLGLVGAFAAASVFLDHHHYYWDLVGVPALAIGFFVCGVFIRSTHLMWETVHLHRLASTDNLTGVANFRFFQVRLEHEIKKSTTAALSVAMFDLDGFKSVNDTAGHGAGNDLLIGLVKRLQPLLKSGDLFARFGGDEFCLMLCGDSARAMALAEAMRKAVADKPFPTRANDQRVTLSMGVTTASAPHLPSGNALVEQADAALYRSKHAGKNRVTLFAPEMLSEAPEKPRRRQEDIPGSPQQVPEQT